MPKGVAPAKGYPVFYVLDPGTSFATLVETVRNQESMFGPAVIVGVGYPSDEEIGNRTFDLTPPSTDPATLPAVFPGGWGPVGGAAQFYDILQDEVRPEIERLARIDNSRCALFGHSLGGLFVLYVLFTHPDSFETYVAGSPSIWWADRVLLKELPAFRRQLEHSHVKHELLITVGGLEDRVNPEEQRLSKQMKLTGVGEFLRLANVIGNAAALAQGLESSPRQLLQVSYVVFPNETHNSSIPAYVGRGARFTLEHWYEK
jgi:predicted alpha/beta superfamily hydrolase